MADEVKSVSGMVDVIVPGVELGRATRVNVAWDSAIKPPRRGSVRVTIRYRAGTAAATWSRTVPASALFSGS